MFSPERRPVCNQSQAFQSLFKEDLHLVELLTKEHPAGCGKLKKGTEGNEA